MNKPAYCSPPLIVVNTKEEKINDLLHTTILPGIIILALNTLIKFHLIIQKSLKKPLLSGRYGESLAEDPVRVKFRQVTWT